MQHIVHIFIGDELVSFRDRFATNYRHGKSVDEQIYFSALSLTRDTNGIISLQSDETGDPTDSMIIDSADPETAMVNFLDSLFQRKVTIVHPGNSNMLVEIWAPLYSENPCPEIDLVINAVTKSRANIKAAIVGFTDDAVTCFVSQPEDRLAPNIYREYFTKNMEHIIALRPILESIRLIDNRNRHGVSLNFTEPTMALVCSEFASILCRNYLTLHQTVSNPETPCESIGLAAIKFDRQYFCNYLRNKVIIDKIAAERIDRREFSINALAAKTNPILQSIIDEIRVFQRERASIASANLGFAKAENTSNIAGEIDAELKDVDDRLKDKINNLFQSSQITLFEREALLALMLGEDCEMFDTSAVRANEITVADIINDSMRFFVNLDPTHEQLNDVSIGEIKDIRLKMRNIAIANRQRQERLEAIKGQVHHSSKNSHIEGNKYIFGDVKYKLGLEIDENPLEIAYQPHLVSDKSIDLRSFFGPIRNQGEQGSCSAMAASSVIEYMIASHPQLSPAFLYYNARALKQECDRDNGSSIFNILKVAMLNGICPEKLMPYKADVFNEAPSEEAKLSAENCKVHQSQGIVIDDNFIDSLKSALCDGYPVIVASKIFDSFGDTHSGFVQHPTKEELKADKRSDKHGKHALVVCGFSDEQKVFVARNSWGEDFGENGYCYIPYSYAKKYFLQACIITQISSTYTYAKIDKKLLSFNEGDANIEAAILKNLISEDSIELADLNKESKTLKTKWSRNVAQLGNVNNQTNLVEKENARISGQISELESERHSLTMKLTEKVRIFKKDQWLLLIILILAALASYFVVYLFPKDLLPWFISIAITFGIVLYVGNIAFSWRKYRQDLRDQIDNIANRISMLERKRSSVAIESHIQGTVLREFGNLQNLLNNELSKLHTFNKQLVETYELTRKELSRLNPEMPYPFLSVLENRNIDRYYDSRSQRLGQGLNMDKLYDEYTPGERLFDLISVDQDLSTSLQHDIRNFTMALLINRQMDRWQFLPDNINLGEIFPNLDQRATPFSTYTADFGNSEKYIFFNGADNHTIAPIIQYFAMPPMPVNDNNSDTITILNIDRFAFN